MVDFVDILDDFRVTLDVFLSFYVCCNRILEAGKLDHGKSGM